MRSWLKYRLWILIAAFCSSCKSDEIFKDADHDSFLSTIQSAQPPRVQKNRTPNWNRFRSTNQYQTAGGKRRRMMGTVKYTKTIQEIVC